MRGLKFVLAFLAVLIGIGVALWFARLPAAGWAVRQAMKGQGLENPQARMAALGLSGARLVDIAAGPSGSQTLQIDFVEVDYRFGELLKEKRVQAARIGPGWAFGRIGEDGAVSIAGIGPKAGGGGGGLAFNALTVEGFDAIIETPDGVIEAYAAGEYDLTRGGKAHLVITTERARFAGLLAEDGDVRLDAGFAEDGAFTFESAVRGNIKSLYGEMRDVSFLAQGEGASWKEVVEKGWRALDAEGAISLSKASLDLGEAPLVAALNENPALFGGPFDLFSLSGDALLSLENGDVYVEAGEAPIAIRAESGAEASLEALLGEPFFMMRDGTAALAGAFAFRGGALKAGIDISAEKLAEGWRFRSPMRLGAFTAEAVALSDVSAVVEGALYADRIDLELTASGAVERAHIGRFEIQDAPAGASLIANFDLEARQGRIDFADGQCAALDRIAVKIEGQDADAALTEARLCAGEKPLALINFSNAPLTDFAASVTARSGSYRLGATRFVGLPPEIILEGRYEPSVNRTIATGTAKGGSVLLNDLIRFDQAEATLSFSLDKNVMTLGAEASRVRMSEYGDNARVAPIYAGGAVKLKGEEAAFHYIAMSKGGTRLGEGEGVHNIRTGEGLADFDFDRLVFKPRGLQPEDLAPVLKGIIGTSGGVMAGAARFSWDRKEIRSGADVSFENFTFEGPGLTVTKTVGVNGAMQLKSLWPVATDGAQTVTVEGVDFGALQLEHGEIVFDMPGDDTLLVDYALFPWFGGEIGVREAKAKFAGGEALAPLRVEGVDLKQILEFVDVEGLSGEGTLNGVMPLVVEDSRASFVDGKLTAEGPGSIRYVGATADQAAAAGEDARIAFDILRDLQYETLEVTIDGPLDGRLDFLIRFEGTGVVSVDAGTGRATGRVPVKYNITLDAALLELLNQANLSRNLQLQIEQAVSQGE